MNDYVITIRDTASGTIAVVGPFDNSVEAEEYRKVGGSAPDIETEVVLLQGPIRFDEG